MNAVVETFFETLESEPVWRDVFQTRAGATEAEHRFIDGFHHPRRRHSGFRFVSPVQSGKRCADQPVLLSIDASQLDIAG